MVEHRRHYKTPNNVESHMKQECVRKLAHIIILVFMCSRLKKVMKAVIAQYEVCS